jgi:hypothetical protein
MASLRLTPNQINVCIVPRRNMLQAPSRISLLEVLARRRSCGVRNPRIGPKRPVKIGRTAHQHRQTGRRASISPWLGTQPGSA